MLLHVKDRKCSQVNLMEQHQQLQPSFEFFGILPQIPQNKFYSCWLVIKLKHHLMKRVFMSLVTELEITLLRHGGL